MKACLLLLAVLLSLGVGTQGCAGCTQLGGTNGVEVSIPSAFYVRGGTVTLALCDGDDCATAVKSIQGKERPLADWGQTFWFDEFDREFSAGAVEAIVEIRDSGNAVIARREEAIELSWVYPNGARCDGNDFLMGEVKLRPVDQL